jgi:hypothetical protein
MFFVAGLLVALAGLFYAAGHHQIGLARCYAMPEWTHFLRQPALGSCRRPVLPPYGVPSSAYDEARPA